MSRWPGVRRFVALAAVAVVACTASVPPVATGSPTVSPAPPTPVISATPAGLADMTPRLLANPLPEADLFDLTRRMRGRDGVPANLFVPVRTSPPVEAVGAARDFWTYDFAAKKNVRVTATLRVLGDHAKWWVQNDVTLDLGALTSSSTFFEQRVYPTDRRLYGSEWSPGVDADPRINILLARIPGPAAGYFSSADELPLWVNEFSAEREMIYANALAARPGTTFLNSVVAHEFCHMIQFNKRVRSSVWFNEGQAQLCEQANGFGLPHAQSFLLLPDTQLNSWPDLEQSQAYYGQSHLFLEFLRQHAGGDDLINAFMAKGIDTPADLDAVLRARGQGTLEDLYADFVAANAFIGAQPVDPRFTYPNGLSARIAATATDQDRASVGQTIRASVHEYAARYVALPRAAFRLHFNGGRQTKLLPTDPHSGTAFWWSDRADGLDSTLTRSVDLRGVTRPSVSFWTWYDVEKDYDYAYVGVSTDGGTRWTTLATRRTTADDPNGNNMGNGFTGVSGGGAEPAWAQEEADLTPYAGKEIMLRFEYVTDPALNLQGFAVDDIEIPGVLKDDAEGDNGWRPNGFVRSTNIVDQRYVVQLLRFTDRGATVERHAVDSGTLDLDVDTSGDRGEPLLAVTAYAVRTTLPVPFEVALETPR